LAAPPPSSSPFRRLPRRKLIFVGAIVIAVIIVVVIIAIILSIQQQQQHNGGTPNVKFITFGADKQEIQVGQSTRVFFNVENSENKIIKDAKVVITIEPQGYEPYLSISNRTVNLPTMFSKDARTGEIGVSIIATGSPAKEAVYVVKGMVFAEGIQSDVKEFRLTIRQ